jgi:hypothetical protein
MSAWTKCAPKELDVDLFNSFGAKERSLRRKSERRAEKEKQSLRPRVFEKQHIWLSRKQPGITRRR